MGDRTKKYLGAKYKIGSGSLSIGDMVTVHPSDNRPDGGKSMARTPYDGEVIDTFIWWTDGAQFEICVKSAWGVAVMNDYLFGRLEKSKNQ